MKIMGLSCKFSLKPIHCQSFWGCVSVMIFNIFHHWRNFRMNLLRNQSDFRMKIMGLSGVNFPLNQSIDNRILWWLSRQRMLMGSDRIMGKKSNFYWWFRGDLMGFNGYIPIHWSLGTVGVRWVDSQDSRLSSESLVSFQPMKFLELRMGTRVRCNTYESVWIIHFFW